MKPLGRTVATFALTIAPHLAAARGHASIPRVTLEEEPSITQSVTFSIPRPPPPPPAPIVELPTSAREAIAACLVLEAASEGDLGLRGVMAVIRNRAGGDPQRFQQVVLRKKQFSALNSVTSGRESLWRAIQRAKRDRTWPLALRIVDEAVHDSWWDPTGGATHYTRSDERTAWARSLARTTIIGAHSFYR